jgi:hypothetical protein
VDVFIWLLGFFSLGLESTLPLPQFIRLAMFLFKHRVYLSSSSNYKQKSLYGFRMSTLLGWVGGDSFKYGRYSIDARLTNANIYELLAGQFTSSHKGRPYSSGFVQFSNSQWTLVGVGVILAEFQLMASQRSLDRD